MSPFVVGTDRRTVVSSSSTVGSEPRTVLLPSGLRHAVPRGARVALCGESPAIRWDEERWPGAARPDDVCVLCRTLGGTP